MALAQLELHRGDKRVLAHGLHDAGGAEHGQTALDSQARVEGALCKLRAGRNADLDAQAAVVVAIMSDGLDLAGNHLARHAVDRRRPDRLVEALARHATHALAAVNLDSRLIRIRHVRHDERAVGDVGVVAAILAHTTARPVLATAHFLDLDNGIDAGRRLDHDGSRRLAVEQLASSGMGGSGSTGAGRVPAAQALLANIDVMLELAHATRPRSRVCDEP